jgi:hypothetical protein
MPTVPITQVQSAGAVPETSYPHRSLSMDTQSLQPPSLQLQRHSLDMGVFAYEGTSTGSTPSSSGAPSWPPATSTAPTELSPATSYFSVPPTTYPVLTPSYSYSYAAQPVSSFSYAPPRTYSPNPAYAPVTHIDPTVFPGAPTKWYDHSQGVSPTCLQPELPRTNSAPMLAGEYEGYHAWTPEMQL